MISKQFADAYDTLVEFCSAAGITKSRHVIHEQSHLLEVSATLDCAAFCGMPVSWLERIRSICTASISLKVELNDLTPFELDDSFAMNWNELSRKLAGAATCEAKLRIDKKSLLTKWFGATAPQIRVYFCRNGLKQNLRDCTLNPATLAQHLWRHFGDGGPAAEGDNIACRAVILVAGCDMLVEGPLLTVVGNDRSGPFPATAAPAGEFDTDNLKAAWKVAEKELRWDNGKVAIGLTPAHIQVDRVDRDVANVAELFRRHWCHLSIMWLADRVVAESGISGRLVAQINGDRAKAEITLDKIQSLPEATAGIEALGKLAFRSFSSPFPSDRLKLARIALARAIRFEPKDEAYQRLVERAPVILKDHDWQWTQFSIGKIDTYIKEERDLEDRIGKAVEAFDGRIGDMIKAVSDTALASVGALIGSMVASVFAGKFNETIFRIGLYAYAGYILVFPGAYGLTNLVFRYRIASRGYYIDAERIERLIGVQRVKEVAGNRIMRTARRFWICFAISIIAYLVLIGLCITASEVVPPMMATSQPSSQPATETSQPTSAPTSQPGDKRTPSVGATSPSMAPVSGHKSTQPTSSRPTTQPFR